MAWRIAGSTDSHPRNRRQRRALRRTAAVALVCALAVAGCGGGSGNDRPAEGAAAASFDKYNQMTGQERKDALIEAAQAEGAVVIYTTAPGYDAVFDAFTEKYGIEVEKFVGRSDTVLQRVMQEQEAGMFTVDIFEDEAAQLLAAEDGLTYEYVNDELTSQLIGYNPETRMVPFRLSVPTVAWNTNLISDAEVPDTVEGLTDPALAGKLVLDGGAFDWYATIRSYLADQGWDDARIDEYFQTLVANSSPQETSIAMTELLSAGEYAMGTSVLTVITEMNQDRGAPVTWRKQDNGYVKPVVVSPEGGVLMANAPHPAAALLLIDFFLEEGAPLLQEAHWPSPMRGTDGSTLSGVADEDILVVDSSVLVEDRQKWQDEYDEVVRGARG